jgi:hypothetical protein
MVGPDPIAAPCGLGQEDPAVLGDAVVGAWEDFLSLVDTTDLSRPSRLGGWTGREACIHLGTWNDHRVLAGIVAAARAGGGPQHRDDDAEHAALVAAHRDASDDDVRAALRRPRSPPPGSARPSASCRCCPWSTPAATSWRCTPSTWRRAAPPHRPASCWAAGSGR